MKKEREMEEENDCAGALRWQNQWESEKEKEEHKIKRRW